MPIGRNSNGDIVGPPGWKPRGVPEGRNPDGSLTEEIVPVIERVSLRPEVQRFAEAMERQLLKKKNEDKGGWKDCDPEYIGIRIHEEANEFIQAIEKGIDVLGEGADIANFIMMMCDIKGFL